MALELTLRALLTRRPGESWGFKKVHGSRDIKYNKYVHIYIFIHEIIAIENDHCDNKQKAIENMWFKKQKKLYKTSGKHTKNCRKSPLWSIIEFNGPWFQLLVYWRVTKSNRGKYPAIMGEYDISIHIQQ
jgi:hypothetical protein